jgi:hypothetical protein
LSRFPCYFKTSSSLPLSNSSTISFTLSDIYSTSQPTETSRLNFSTGTLQHPTQPSTTDPDFSTTLDLLEFLEKSTVIPEPPFLSPSTSSTPYPPPIHRKPPILCQGGTVHFHSLTQLHKITLPPPSNPCLQFLDTNGYKIIALKSEPPNCGHFILRGFNSTHLLNLLQNSFSLNNDHYPTASVTDIIIQVGSLNFHFTSLHQANSILSKTIQVLTKAFPIAHIYFLPPTIPPLADATQKTSIRFWRTALDQHILSPNITLLPQVVGSRHLPFLHPSSVPNIPHHTTKSPHTHYKQARYLWGTDSCHDYLRKVHIAIQQRYFSVI